MELFNNCCGRKLRAHHEPWQSNAELLKICKKKPDIIFLLTNLVFICLTLKK